MDAEFVQELRNYDEEAMDAMDDLIEDASDSSDEEAEAVGALQGFLGRLQRLRRGSTAKKRTSTLNRRSSTAQKNKEGLLGATSRRASTMLRNLLGQNDGEKDEVKVGDVELGSLEAIAEKRGKKRLSKTAKKLQRLLEDDDDDYGNEDNEDNGKNDSAGSEKMKQDGDEEKDGTDDAAIELQVPEKATLGIISAELASIKPLPRDAIGVGSHTRAATSEAGIIVSETTRSSLEKIDSISRADLDEALATQATTFVAALVEARRESGTGPLQENDVASIDVPDQAALPPPTQRSTPLEPPQPPEEERMSASVLMEKLHDASR